jgi:hypothetical protein
MKPYCTCRVGSFNRKEGIMPLEQPPEPFVVLWSLPSAGRTRVVSKLKKLFHVPLDIAPIRNKNLKDLWRDTAYVNENKDILFEIFGRSIFDDDGKVNIDLATELLFSPVEDRQVCEWRRKHLRIKLFAPFVESLETKLRELKRYFPGQLIVFEHCFASSEDQEIEFISKLKPSAVVTLECPKEIRIERLKNKKENNKGGVPLRPIDIRLMMLETYPTDEDHHDRGVKLAEHFPSYIINTNCSLLEERRAVLDMYRFLVTKGIAKHPL